MRYLKVFTDFAGSIEELNDAEVGRLFRAMLSYAESGTVPDLKGNERFIWGTAKMNIDKQSISYNNKVKGADTARNIRSDIRSNQNNISDIRKTTLISEQEKEKEKEKDKDKEEVVVVSDETTCRTQDVRPIIDAWNSLGMTQLMKLSLSSSRGKMLKARINDYGIDGVVSAINRIGCSTFLRGQNSRNWQITFDWFVKPNNFVKVYEGNYDDRTVSTSRLDWIDEVSI